MVSFFLDYGWRVDEDEPSSFLPPNKPEREITR
jgi:hypothetical protein